AARKVAQRQPAARLSAPEGPASPVVRGAAGPPQDPRATSVIPQQDPAPEARADGDDEVTATWTVLPEDPGPADEATDAAPPKPPRAPRQPRKPATPPEGS
ncbi:mechanosensitive ion channel protein, partial [Clavibacter lycopersici]